MLNKIYIDKLVFSRTSILDKNLALQHCFEFSEQLFVLFFQKSSNFVRFHWLWIEIPTHLFTVCFDVEADEEL